MNEKTDFGGIIRLCGNPVQTVFEEDKHDCEIRVPKGDGFTFIRTEKTEDNPVDCLNLKFMNECVMQKRTLGINHETFDVNIGALNHNDEVLVVERTNAPWSIQIQANGINIKGTAFSPENDSYLCGVRKVEAIERVCKSCVSMKIENEKTIGEVDWNVIR